MFLLLLISAVLLYFYWKIRKAQSYWKERGVKYVEPKFLIGNMSVIHSKSFVDLTVDLYNKFPEERYHGIYQFLLPTLLIKDPDLIKQIGIKEFESFMDHRKFVPPEVDPLWNKNLFATTGEHWRDMRTTLSPSFTGSKMKTMFVLMDDCAKQFVNYFKNHDEETAELEMKDIFSRYTNDVIATAAFGIKCDSLENKTNDFFLLGKKATNFRGFNGLKFFSITISPVIAKLFKFKIVATDVANYFTNIVKETVATREKQKIVRPDMIHLLMEARKGRALHDEDLVDLNGPSMKLGKQREITIDDIAAQAFIFFLAGFDTASTLLSFAFHELAVNPDVQSKLRQEIKTVKEESGDGKISYETLQGMKYLDMVVSEVLRKWPPAIFTDRTVTKPFTIQPVKPGEKPLRLEVGTVCWLPVIGVHRDPKHYPNPMKFDPERFNEENKRARNPSTYLPFGIGPRLCIGSRFALLEAKLIICYLLDSFEVVPVKKTRIPLVLEKDVVIAAEGGMWLGFKKIQ